MYILYGITFYLLKIQYAYCHYFVWGAKNTRVFLLGIICRRAATLNFYTKTVYQKSNHKQNWIQVIHFLLWSKSKKVVLVSGVQKYIVDIIMK